MTLSLNKPVVMQHTKIYYYYFACHCYGYYIITDFFIFIFFNFFDLIQDAFLFIPIQIQTIDNFYVEIGFSWRPLLFIFCVSIHVYTDIIMYILCVVMQFFIE